MSSEFIKFPATPHLIKPTTGFGREDKLMSSADITALLTGIVCVEEKIDGANIGFSFDENGQLLIQNRGSYITGALHGQFAFLTKWLPTRIEILHEVLGERYILFGEWCYARHTVFYNALPDYFLGFDIFDRQRGRFLSVARRNQMFARLGISFVPLVFSGKVNNLSFLKSLMNGSAYGSVAMEGLYVRLDEEGFLKLRGKIVRDRFIQTNEQHWSGRALEKNLVSYSDCQSRGNA